jgi:hypothetical protein
MNLKQRELEIKLDLLRSLARSQNALAAMVEALAEMRARLSPQDRDVLLKELGAIRAFQRALADKWLKLQLRPIRRGTPGAHWVAETCKIRATSRRS